MKLKLILKTEDGRELINETITGGYTLSNDLEDAPNFVGNIYAAAKYSRGFHIEVNGFVPNPKEVEDFNEAMEENAKGVMK